MYLSPLFLSLPLLLLPTFSAARVLDAFDERALTPNTQNNDTTSPISTRDTAGIAAQDLANVQRCLTTTAPPELRDTHVYFRENPTKHLTGRAAAGNIIVQTHVHVVATEDQAPYYASKNTRNDLVQGQIIALNTAYRAAHISFALASTTFTIKNVWATDANSTAMKTALRSGSYSHLNIYFQSNLSSYPYVYSAGASTLLGYCTLPTKMTYDDGSGGPEVEFPREDYATDGCSVLGGSMPGVGGSVPRGYTMGKTAVHEVGHWFGLLHTFQDSSCDPTDVGDYCDDTPQESVSTEGCPINPPKDSCPGCPGADPVHNFMDYSSDAWLV